MENFALGPARAVLSLAYSATSWAVESFIEKGEQILNNPLTATNAIYKTNAEVIAIASKTIGTVTYIKQKNSSPTLTNKSLSPLTRSPSSHRISVLFPSDEYLSPLAEEEESPDKNDEIVVDLTTAIKEHENNYFLSTAFAWGDLTRFLPLPEILAQYDQIPTIFADTCNLLSTLYSFKASQTNINIETKRRILHQLKCVMFVAKLGVDYFSSEHSKIMKFMYYSIVGTHVVTAIQDNKGKVKEVAQKIATLSTNPRIVIFTALAVLEALTKFFVGEGNSSEELNRAKLYLITFSAIELGIKNKTVIGQIASKISRITLPIIKAGIGSTTEVTLQGLKKFNEYSEKYALDS